MKAVNIACVLVTLAWGPVAISASAQSAVPAVVETAPVPSDGDAADDSAVWVHPTQRGLSTVIGTDKDAGLAVYDLAGNQLQFLPDGELNNVDLRYRFALGGAEVALVCSGERGGDVLAVYAVDPATRLLRNVAARAIPLGIDVYGCCMYQSRLTRETYFFGTSGNGEVEQWRLFDDGTGRVDAVRVRAFDVGGQVEGCVADDEAGLVFFGEEEVGIWRYGAEPGDGTVRVQVDHTGAGGHLTEDVEGLALYDAPLGAGYLIASSQGSDSYVVYERRPPHAYRTTFSIAANPALGIDAVTETDGIEVLSLGLGSAFPNGLFIAQDGSNPGANQNFKLVSWDAIANSAVPPLLITPSDEPPGTACTPATVRSRNGSGANPLSLTSADVPRLGAVWMCDLDCSAHTSGTAFVAAFARPATGPLIAEGELLVDLASPRYFSLSAPHAGSMVRFRVPIPARVELCGQRAFVQGICSGAPAARLSNALDLRLGL